MTDLRKEAKRQIKDKTELYNDVLADMSNEGVTGENKLMRELMQRLVNTSSRFEHLEDQL